MVKFIESELVLLKKEVDEMWTLVYNQLERAADAVLTSDRELAQQVCVCERRVNAFELKIDSDVEDIIALYTPVAIDLRFVLAMLKINTNLERLGDFAESVARFALEEKELTLDADLVKRLRLQEMIDQVLSMLELAKRALQEESQELATSVSRKTMCWMKSMPTLLPCWQNISSNILKALCPASIWQAFSASWSVPATTSRT